MEAADQRRPPVPLGRAGRRAAGRRTPPRRTSGSAPGRLSVSSVAPGSSRVPTAAYSRAPRSTSSPTRAQVSALLSSVGRPWCPATASGCQLVTGRFGRPDEQLDHGLGLAGHEARRRRRASAPAPGRRAPRGPVRIAAAAAGRSPGSTTCTSRARSARAVATAPSSTRCGRVSARAASLAAGRLALAQVDDHAPAGRPRRSGLELGRERERRRRRDRAGATRPTRLVQGVAVRARGSVAVLAAGARPATDRARCRPAAPARARRSPRRDRDRRRRPGVVGADGAVRVEVRRHRRTPPGSASSWRRRSGLQVRACGARRGRVRRARQAMAVGTAAAHTTVTTHSPRAHVAPHPHAVQDRAEPQGR